MKHYLSMGECAERLGIAASTFTAYYYRNQGPPPDAMIGKTPGWLPETIDTWNANRPGRGNHKRP